MHTPESRLRAYKKVVARKKHWFKIMGPCNHCGSTKNLELDHVKRDDKISSKIWSWRLERIVAELKKCQILCHDCHLKKTIKENSKPAPHGHPNTYKSRKYRCRCNRCREAVKIQMRNYRLKKQAA